MGREDHRNDPCREDAASAMFRAHELRGGCRRCPLDFDGSCATAAERMRGTRWDFGEEAAAHLGRRVRQRVQEEGEEVRSLSCRRLELARAGQTLALGLEEGVLGAKRATRAPSRVHVPSPFRAHAHATREEERRQPWIHSTCARAYLCRMGWMWQWLER